MSSDLSSRCPLKTLQKCEIALEKLKNDMAVVRRRHLQLLLRVLFRFCSSAGLFLCPFQPTPPPPPVPTKQQYFCQPLLDAVMARIRSPVFNHSLYRTFAPAMSAIHGPPIT